MGISGTALLWFESYLSDRSFRVSWRGEFSKITTSYYWGSSRLSAWSTITPSRTARNLRVVIDDQLSFTDHITTTAWSCRFALYNIRKIVGIYKYLQIPTTSPCQSWPPNNPHPLDWLYLSLSSPPVTGVWWAHWRRCPVAAVASSKWMLHTGGGWGETPHMIVKRFGCTTIHKKRYINASFIQD